MTAYRPYLLLVGRILLALLFVLTGYGKIGGYAGTQGYMANFGVPGILLPFVILVELGGGLLVVAGYKTRWAALALAVFCILAALIFHSNLGDQGQFISFFKNLAIAGGFLVLAASGPGSLSLDRE